VGYLGPIAFDENGDVRPRRVAVFGSRAGRLVYRETISLERGAAG
jgi:hypothetical protein